MTGGEDHNDVRENPPLAAGLAAGAATIKQMGNALQAAPTLFVLGRRGLTAGVAIVALKRRRAAGTR